MTARLTSNLAAASGGALTVPTDALSATPEALRQLPPDVLGVLQTALSDAVTFVFLVAVPATAVAFALAWALKELPLRTSTGGISSAMAEGVTTVETTAEIVDR
jgi:hypothetical protein